ALADTIVVPAAHAARSFVDHGVPAEKLFRNVYGVSLEMFPPTAKPTATHRTAIMVGLFSHQKGADVLVDAMGGMRDARLLHVGAKGDCPFPTAPWFETVGPVPQQEIARLYACANVAVLASR